METILLTIYVIIVCVVAFVAPAAIIKLIKDDWKNGKI